MPPDFISSDVLKSFFESTLLSSRSRHLPRTWSSGFPPPANAASADAASADAASAVAASAARRWPHRVSSASVISVALTTGDSQKAFAVSSASRPAWVLPAAGLTRSKSVSQL